MGKGSREINAIHLMKTYCLPTLTYGIENAAICDNTKHKMQVIWNNCFRHIFSCCWRETVKPLQYRTSVIFYHCHMLLTKTNYFSGKNVYQ